MRIPAAAAASDALNHQPSGARFGAGAGASLTIIGRSLGRKSIQSAAIYAQLLADPVRASLEGAVNTMLTHGGAKTPREVVQLPTNKTERRSRKS